jgi:hypothetical protein
VAATPLNKCAPTVSGADGMTRNEPDEKMPFAIVFVSITEKTLTGEFGKWEGVVANATVSSVVPASTPASDDSARYISTTWPDDVDGLAIHVNHAVVVPTAPTASEIVAAIDWP